MKFKAVVAAALVCSAIVVVVAQSSSQNRQNPTSQEVAQLEGKEQKGGMTLKERARLARSRGQQKLTLDRPNDPVIEFTDFESALSNHTAVIAQPTASTSYIVEGNGLNSLDEIVTCYKLKTLEKLSESARSEYPAPGGATSPLRPLAEGEFITCHVGGTVNVEGVEVTAKKPKYPSLSLDKSYLLFVKFDATGQVANMPMGSMVSLPLNEDGTFELTDWQPGLLKEKVGNQYGRSVEHLKDDLKRIGELKKAGRGR